MYGRISCSILMCECVSVPCCADSTYSMSIVFEFWGRPYHNFSVEVLYVRLYVYLDDDMKKFGEDPVCCYCCIIISL